MSRLSSRLFTLPDIIIMGQLHEHVRPDVQTRVCRDQSFVATKLILTAAPANDRQCRAGTLALEKPEVKYHRAWSRRGQVTVTC